MVSQLACAWCEKPRRKRCRQKLKVFVRAVRMHRPKYVAGVHSSGDGRFKGDRLKELKKRVEGVKSVQPEPAVIEDNFNAEEIAPQDGMTAPLASHQPPLRLVFGEWSAWSQWTPCVGGERSRIRACSSKRAALRIVCHGDAKETQKCFSAVDSYVPVAEDPWTIEREISGDFKI
ncbi:unnamed protein product [Nippostrongylus brasiliensis]|uniref:Uncharacterized protein n=1 Tax=Nippostrongylus brasiliensis TaxID=27835 RepID=A0A158R2G0_NIPBR|nr:unnamed protein product [Nippostrongylus brasiliensis]